MPAATEEESAVIGSKRWLVPALSFLMVAAAGCAGGGDISPHKKKAPAGPTAA